MHQFTKRELYLSGLLIVFMTSAIAAGAYYLGYQRNIETVKLMERQLHINDGQYGDSLEVVQKDNAEIATRNVVICAEYQELYQAYIELRDQLPSSQTEFYTRPGSASGNVDPCYGEI